MNKLHKVKASCCFYERLLNTIGLQMNEKILGLKRNTVSNPYIVVGFPDLDFIKKKLKERHVLSFFLKVYESMRHEVAIM